MIEGKRKLALGMLISLQVGVLIIFKYLNFFIETINTVIPTSVSTLNIIVPLGISFFTFQQIAYSVDVYRGEIEKRNFLDYLCFSFLFITISSGPIIYYNEIIPQLDDEKKSFSELREYVSRIAVISCWIMQEGTGCKRLFQCSHCRI